LAVVDVARDPKVVSRSPAKPVSRGSPAGVVVKSLAEIKREKVSRMPPRLPAADEMQTHTSERHVQRNRLDSKIKLSASIGTTFLPDFVCVTGTALVFWVIVIFPRCFDSVGFARVVS